MVDNSLRHIFGFKGKCTRAPWWGIVILTNVVLPAIVLVLAMVGGVGVMAAMTYPQAMLGQAFGLMGLIVVGVFYFCCYWLMTATSVRRLHDIGVTGWWFLAGVAICMATSFVSPDVAGLLALGLMLFLGVFPGSTSQGSEQAATSGHMASPKA